MRRRARERDVLPQNIPPTVSEEATGCVNLMSIRDNDEAKACRRGDAIGHQVSDRRVPHLIERLYQHVGAGHEGVMSLGTSGSRALRGRNCCAPNCRPSTGLGLDVRS